MIATYYNEWEPYSAQYLRNLMAAGELPHGVVDEQSIEEVEAFECEPTSHFFAGVGGWPLALRLAGWPEDRPVWTGSPPCQPFSSAGAGGGSSDARHLWPAWFRVIRECVPPTLFGEQTASPAGRVWVAALQADLEALGYAFVSVDLCAAGVGAPGIRQRLFWVADRSGERRDEGPQHRALYKWNEPWGTGVGDRRATCDWLQCDDGKSRPTQPGVYPLAPRLPGHVGRIRAFGNAIVPQVAATFIRAFLETQEVQ